MANNAEKVKAAKQAVKEAKALATDAKKYVAATMKAFMDSPCKERGADYRGAVAAHVKAVTAMDKAEAKLRAVTASE